MKGGKHLGKDIIEAAKKVGIDPFKMSFTPKGLKLKASDYGSFADWCSPEDTKSSKWNKHVCLKVAQRNNSGKPTRYVLLPRRNWLDC